MTTILAVSDWEIAELTDMASALSTGSIDLVLACGDLAPEYLARLHAARAAPVLYVRGNHDIRPSSIPMHGCTDIHGRLVQCKGLRILGLEGSRWYNGGPAQYTERQMKRILRQVRPLIRQAGGVDLVITHAPPRHVHDRQDRCHRGFKCFHQIIEQVRPAYWLHGHIHDPLAAATDRQTLVHQTQVINCNGQFILEIDAGRLAGQAG